MKNLFMFLDKKVLKEHLQGNIGTIKALALTTVRVVKIHFLKVIPNLNLEQDGQVFSIK